MILFFLAHLLGDYVVQSQWMAEQKTKRWWPAVVHGATYGACYLLVTRNIPALLVIAGTHVIIDHWRLIKPLLWAKNQLAPAAYRYKFPGGPFSERVDPELHAVEHNFSPVVPRQIAAIANGFALNFWLMVIGDNTAHLLINYAAIRWL